MSTTRFCAPLLLPPQPQLQAIEVASRLQLPGIQIIGLPGPEVAEARERIGAALESIGSGILTRRVILNLTPAALRKRGTSADLAMALACLSSLHSPSTRPLGTVLALGELGLSGEIKACTGMAATLLLAVENQIPWVLVPESLLDSAIAALDGLSQLSGSPPSSLPQVLGLSHLGDAWEWVKHGTLPAQSFPQKTELKLLPENESPLYRLSPLLERWCGVLAAGRHHTLVLGVRGSGKTQFLEWVAALQGDLSREESLWRWSQGLDLELTHGSTPRHSAVRRVMPEISATALVGSATHGLDRLLYGELTLAHGGALIANEFLEWKRPARECLREPLESGVVHLASLHGRVSLPARFQLLASANWCECGDSEHPDSVCRCSPHQKRTYWSRLSGPILERLDFCMALSPSQPQAPTQIADPEHTRALRARVTRTQERLRARWGCLPGEPGTGKSPEFWAKNGTTLQDAESCLAAVSEDFEYSRRSRHQILRLAATLHAWDAPESNEPWSPASIQEAALYRKQIEQWARYP